MSGIVRYGNNNSLLQAASAAPAKDEEKDEGFSPPQTEPRIRGRYAPQQARSGDISDFVTKLKLENQKLKSVLRYDHQKNKFVYSWCRLTFEAPEATQKILLSSYHKMMTRSVHSYAPTARQLATSATPKEAGEQNELPQSKEVPAWIKDLDKAQLLRKEACDVYTKCWNQLNKEMARNYQYDEVREIFVYKWLGMTYDAPKEVQNKLLPLYKDAFMRKRY